ncbi:hypothetical protein [Candidatus Ferrigenium straubiae]|jgi:hypothetical protein|uniref:hypothetical protein n=1 Tax=Candidatus Ferrigenium straubiae TaxID=2919506 RepID=UPI003F4ACAD1
MKKIALSLAGVLAATAFAPEASAIPSFARQTGMACSACHFQHFPVLNSFGMAFKSAGYTMMGAQSKIEGEHLSIPDTLNASVLLKIRYQKTNGVDTAANAAMSGATTNSGQWQMPDEMSMFLGGRAAENIGFVIEGNLAGNNAAGNGGIATGFKMPFMFDAGGAKVGVVPFWTDVLGPAHGYELSSSGMVRGLRWSEDRSSIAAANFVGLNNGAATGLAFVAKNDMGYINWTRWSPTQAGSLGGAGTKQFKANWVRLAATPNYADWNMHIGLGFMSGSTNQGVAATPVDRKGSTLDFQGQTQLGGKDFSLYASYARAPGGAGTTNAYNNVAGVNNPNAKKAFQIGADYSVIPHVLHLGASYLDGDTGAAALNKDKAFMIQGIYDMVQNVALHASYTKYSGSVYDLGGAKDKTVAGNSGDSLLMFMLEASF